jgi:hypothetical protein
MPTKYSSEYYNKNKAAINGARMRWYRRAVSSKKQELRKIRRGIIAGIKKPKAPKLVIPKKKNYSTPGLRYKQYRVGARKRGFLFEVTRPLFDEITSGACHYCGGNYERMGIDRVNNELGYVDGNMVPCCAVCNRMKSTQTKDGFIEHCKKIADHWS